MTAFTTKWSILDDWFWWQNIPQTCATAQWVIEYWIFHSSLKYSNLTTFSGMLFPIHARSKHNGEIEKCCASICKRTCHWINQIVIPWTPMWWWWQNNRNPDRILTKHADWSICTNYKYHGKGPIGVNVVVWLISTSLLPSTTFYPLTFVICCCPCVVDGKWCWCHCTTMYLVSTNHCAMLTVMQLPLPNKHCFLHCMYSTPSIQNYVHSKWIFITVFDVKDLMNSFLYHLIK